MIKLMATGYSVDSRTVPVAWARAKALIRNLTAALAIFTTYFTKLVHNFNNSRLLRQSTLLQMFVIHVTGILDHKLR